MADEAAAPVQATTTTAPVETPVPNAQSAPPVETTAPVGGLENNGQVAEPVVNEPKAEPVPEKYELKLKENSPLKPEQIAEVEAFAKAHKLTPAQAQSALERQETLVQSFREEALKSHQARVEGWAKAAQSDPEYGGEKLNANMEIAKRALTKYGGENFSKLLDETGYGNHPEVLRVFYKIGQAMTEGNIVAAPGQVTNDVPFHDRFYDQSRRKK